MILLLVLLAVFAGPYTVSGWENTLITDMINTRFQELYHTDDSLCSHEAVEEYIHECSEYGADNVNPRIRLQSAVRLSVCEFVEARVYYPEVCHDLDSDERFNQCVQEFRKSSQLWTTYSGHYRRLRSVCYEEALPYVRARLLDLFFNVTEIYSEFHRASTHATTETQKFQEEILSRFQSLLDLMDGSRVDREKQKERQEKDFEAFHQSMVVNSQSIEQFWERSFQNLIERHDVLEHSLTTTQTKLESMLAYIDTSYASFSLTNMRLASSHRETAEIISENMDSLVTAAQRGSEVLATALDENLRRSEEVNMALLSVGAQLKVAQDLFKQEYNTIITTLASGLKQDIWVIVHSLEAKIANFSSNLLATGDVFEKNVIKLADTLTGFQSVSAKFDGMIQDARDTFLFSFTSSGSRILFVLIIGGLFVNCAILFNNEYKTFVLAIILGSLSAVVLLKCVATFKSAWGFLSL